MVVFISGIISMIIGVRLIGNGIIRQAQDKVRLDLNSAREVYHEENEAIKTVVRLIANRFFIKNAILDKSIAKLQAELQKIREDESLDILTLTDKQGRILTRARNPVIYGDNVNDEIVSWVLLRKQPVVATLIISKEELEKEGNDLATQSRIELMPTPKARPRTEAEETSGMMIKAAAPVFDYNGELIGVLYGGKLINQNYEIVDKVKDIVYKGEKYKGKDMGTVTIFQGDLRISTNVRRTDGARAIGTRVSQEVYDQVIGKGIPWIARAFVVNDWYITAYEPIKDIENNIIGILYVGLLEQKFTDMRNDVIFTFLGITILGIAIAFGVSFFLANSIVKPVSRLATASKHIADGDFSYKVDIKSNDEIGELGDIFDFMVRSIREQNAKIKELAQLKIAEAERLAMVGQLAAGVAHEINNPLTGILLYCDLVLKNMSEDDPRRKNLEKINHEAMRCKTIVKGLLDFSRQTEPEIKPSSINKIVDDVLSLVKNQPLFLNITINKKKDPSLPVVNVDAAQIQQVSMNIILNAVEAMNGTGELTITTGLTDDKKYIFSSFTDTGCGIAKENLSKIFEPFFSTKKTGRGTGLGLSISYGIIKKHHGEIEVTSELGKGTTFIVKLPVLEEEHKM
ncbi:Adaptive-response sensory-kinase SasA [subsurface metagenome]